MLCGKEGVREAEMRVPSERTFLGDAKHFRHQVHTESESNDSEREAISSVVFDRQR